jgi:Domain of unknown function (DUF1874)
MNLISIDDAKLLLQEGYSSYVGDRATNTIIEKLFNIELPYNRSMYNQQIGEKAIVFKLNKRLEE